MKYSAFVFIMWLFKENYNVSFPIIRILSYIVPERKVMFRPNPKYSKCKSKHKDDFLSKQTLSKVYTSKLRLW